MKKIIVFGLLLLFTVLAVGCSTSPERDAATGDSTSAAPAPPAAPPPGRGVATATLGGHEVSIDYGRPPIKGARYVGPAPGWTILASWAKPGHCDPGGHRYSVWRHPGRGRFL